MHIVCTYRGQKKSRRSKKAELDTRCSAGLAGSERHARGKTRRVDEEVKGIGAQVEIPDEY